MVFPDCRCTRQFVPVRELLQFFSIAVAFVNASIGLLCWPVATRKFLSEISTRKFPLIFGKFCVSKFSLSASVRWHRPQQLNPVVINRTSLFWRCIQFQFRRYLYNFSYNVYSWVGGSALSHRGKFSPNDDTFFKQSAHPCVGSPCCCLESYQNHSSWSET